MFSLRHVPAGMIGAFSLAFAGLAHGQATDAADDEGVKIRFQGGVNAVAERNLFWRFAETVAQADDFASDTEWLEAYVKPGLSYQRTTSSGATLYGGLSAVGSWTAGSDAFGTGDIGRVTLEEAYAGVRFNQAGFDFDLSAGSQEFEAGTGMNLSNGGSNGFSRGALKLGPRKAWAMAVLARAKRGDVSSTAFYLDPNSAPDNDNGTRIAGFDVRYDPDEKTYYGATIGKVVESRAPYPVAAPGGIGVPSILENGRDGLTFVDLYMRARPFADALPGAFVVAEVSLQNNDRIDMRAWGGRAWAGYDFNHRWKPSFGFGYQTFSGDDPNTTRLERFDPLYYEGNPKSWSTGSKSSMVFINSNVASWNAGLSLSPTPRDKVSLQVSRILANERLSPIQFGQATRVEIEDGIANPISGVTRRHLSDDIYLEYMRVVTPNVYLTAGFSVSVPGPGINSIVTEVDAPTWSGGFVNLIVNY
ncbi:alginate export family protein [Brevundimonas sp.]|uniref:alginate export family protein n=1 Tax=Brevundimonas sp. TaxID=1871086 RepID=UPI002FCBDCED